MHKKQKIKKLILIIFLILVCAVLIRIYTTPQKQVLPVETQSASVISSTLIVDKTTLNLTSVFGTSLYDILLKEKEAGTLSFSGKEYPGMGFFTTDIGTLHSTKDHYLMYYVNGKEAEVGISFYFPQNGDVIEWKLK